MRPLDELTLFSVGNQRVKYIVFGPGMSWNTIYNCRYVVTCTKA